MTSPTSLFRPEYRSLSAGDHQLIADVKNAAATLAAISQRISPTLSEFDAISRERGAAVQNGIENLETSVFWMMKAINSAAGPANPPPVFQKTLSVNDVARLCHELNRAWCQMQGDNSQKSWEEAEEWQLASSISGVKFALGVGNACSYFRDAAGAQHQAWVEDKVRDGWVYGPVKDAEQKTHPCLVPFEELSASDIVKDFLFAGLVRSLAPLIDCSPL